MPSYRIYYAQQDVSSGDIDRVFGRYPGDGRMNVEVQSEEHWEESVEGRDPYEALDDFFREHLDSNARLMWVDDKGRTHAVEGHDLDVGKTYVWIEDGSMMELQGIEEGTPGMVSCPLCDGAGEIDEATADEFAAMMGEEEAPEEF